MGKGFRLFLAYSLFFWAINAIANNAHPLILSIENDFSQSKDSVEFYMDLEKLYIKSIIDNDLDLKKQVLIRLVESSKKLGKDTSVYEKELYTLQKTIKKNNITNDNLTTESNKTTKNKKEKTNDIEKTRYITGIDTGLSFVKIKFSDSLENKIKSSSLNNKGYFRNIYDIKGVLQKPQPNIKLNNSEQVRIAQFDKQTVRIVIFSTKEIKSKVSFDKNIFTINSSSEKEVQILPKEDKEKSDKVVLKNKKIIVLDPGHGGKDPGAKRSDKFLEKDIVLSIALLTYKELEKRGYTVYLTRSSDKTLLLQERTEFANKNNADLFLSIHANAAPNKKSAASMEGIETYFLSPARSERSKNVAALENKSELEDMNFYSQEVFLNFLNREKIIASNKLAIDIQGNILLSLKNKYKIIDGGVREAPFWVLVGAQMPAVLLEVGYISHDAEYKRLFNSSYQKLISQGIADGIDAYFQKNQ